MQILKSSIIIKHIYFMLLDNSLLVILNSLKYIYDFCLNVLFLKNILNIYFINIINHLIFIMIFSFSVGYTLFLMYFMIWIGSQAQATIIPTLSIKTKSMAATSIWSFKKMMDKIYNANVSIWLTNTIRLKLVSYV